MMDLLMWLLFHGRRCPWGCGSWVNDSRIVEHWTVEHAGDPGVAQRPARA